MHFISLDQILHTLVTGDRMRDGIISLAVIEFCSNKNHSREDRLAASNHWFGRQMRIGHNY